MNPGISGKILGATDEIRSFWSNLEFWSRPAAILDILIVAFLIWWLYALIRHTRAIRIVYGIAFLLVLWLIGRVFDLRTLNFLLRYSVTAILIAIPVVFQPELRAALEKLGRPRFVPDFAGLKKREISALIKELIEATEVLTHQKRGALVVISRHTGLKDFIETGTELDAKVSSKLLINIFGPKSLLHDGATIVTGNRIASTGSILPLSDSNLDVQLGTRHRAAVGLTSQTDALVVVISEERGEISFASEGLLETNLTIETLEKHLVDKLIKEKTSSNLLAPSKLSPKNKLKEWTS